MSEMDKSLSFPLAQPINMHDQEKKRHSLFLRTIDKGNLILFSSFRRRRLLLLEIIVHATTK